MQIVFSVRAAASGPISWQMQDGNQVDASPVKQTLCMYTYTRTPDRHTGHTRTRAHTEAFHVDRPLLTHAPTHTHTHTDRHTHTHTHTHTHRSRVETAPIQGPWVTEHQGCRSPCLLRRSSSIPCSASLPRDAPCVAQPVERQASPHHSPTRVAPASAPSTLRV